ncbi:MAG TPA: twin-arginine translocation signal domain-containing protein, partial [Verrucomicrobiae bacterium]
MNRRGFLQIGAAATVAAVFTRGSRAAETAEAGPRFLLLDSRVVEKADGARLTVGTARKHP